MLPRSVAVLIAVALTLAELVNVAGQVFLGTGDTAIHVMYPAVLGALGLTTKRPDAEPSPTQDTGTPGVTAVDTPPVIPLETRAARHRHRGSP